MYQVKMGYKVSANDDTENTQWWWTKLWKLPTLSKSKIFLWLALNKILIWANLLKRGSYGPEVCSLCKSPHSLKRSGGS